MTLLPEDSQTPSAPFKLKVVLAKQKLELFLDTLKNIHIDIVGVKEDGFEVVCAVPTVVGLTETFSPATPVQYDLICASDDLYTDLILPLLAEKYTKHDRDFSVSAFYGARRCTICVDLDDTLVLHTVRRDEYSSWDDFYEGGTPRVALIKLLTDYKKKYNPLIVIYTARPLVHLATTIRQLQKHLIPYDALCHTKPRADMYIDDRGVNPHTDSMYDAFRKVFAEC